MLHDRVGSSGNTSQLQDEMSKLAAQHEASHKDLAARHKSSLDEATSKLKGELASVAKDHEDKHGKLRSAVLGSVEATEKKLKEQMAAMHSTHDENHKESRNYLASHSMLTTEANTVNTSLPYTQQRTAPTRTLQLQLRRGNFVTLHN